MAIVTASAPVLIASFSDSSSPAMQAETIIKYGSLVTLYTAMQQRSIGIGVMPSSGGGSGGAQGSISFN